jgi:hypothetical protein
MSVWAMPGSHWTQYAGPRAPYRLVARGYSGLGHRLPRQMPVPYIYINGSGFGYLLFISLLEALVGRNSGPAYGAA